MAAFTNVLETFKEQEHAQRKGQLKRAWLAALVLANFMEGNAGKVKICWRYLFYGLLRSAGDDKYFHCTLWSKSIFIFLKLF